MKIGNFIIKYIHLIFLLVIIYLAIALRLTTADTEILLDYDPWWFFRHAQEILDNGMAPPRWDLLSYFPPGRPVNYQLGWSYTLATFYLIAQAFTSISLMKFSTYFIAIFSGICAIPAYYVGKMVTNRWGGLITALFAVITPTFLSVSMAGYPDSDAMVVFYTFLAVITTILAIERFKGFRDKKSWLYIGLAVASYWLFAFNWNTSWYIYYMFIGFIPIYILFLIIESYIKKEYHSFTSRIIGKIKQSKNLVVPILLIGVIAGFITFLTQGWPYNTVPPLEQLFTGLQFLGGEWLIVNISVAELQPINVFTREGFLAIANRIGMFPVLLAIFGLFSITILKLYYRKKITKAEYFAIIWMIISFWLITRGIRFSLIFSLSIATAAGFVVGNLVEYFKNKKNLLLAATIYGIILVGLIFHISDNASFSAATTGLQINQNWRDALNWLEQNGDSNTLVATWWDPGHIITGNTDLKVHADGAHCDVTSCIPYNHNIRISDMGRIFSTSDEDESLSILKKYTSITDEQCQTLKQSFGDGFPEEGCSKIDKIYFIASGDLIGKYYWLSCFGSFDFETKQCNGQQFIQLGLRNYQTDEQGNLQLLDYGQLSLVFRENQLIPVIDNRFVVRELVYFENNEVKHVNFGNDTETIDGLVWTDPSFQTIIFMPPEIRDSVFTRMYFFNGEGLNNFELQFNNAEIKIFKVNL